MWRETDEMVSTHFMVCWTAQRLWSRNVTLTESCRVRIVAIEVVNYNGVDVDSLRLDESRSRRR